MQRSTIEKHCVFITDETGMASVFPQLKRKLAEDRLTAITILYHSGDNQFIFRKELDILVWHFPSRLYVSYEAFVNNNENVVNQASVEAVINANIVSSISFLISGDFVFTKKTEEVLLFLGVSNIDIQEQFFSCL